MKKSEKYEWNIFFLNNLNIVILFCSYSFMLLYLVITLVSRSQYVYITYEFILRYLCYFSYFHFHVLFLLAVNYFSHAGKVELKEAIMPDNMRKMEKKQISILRRINLAVVILLVLYVCFAMGYLYDFRNMKWNAFWRSILTVIVDYGLIGIIAIYLSCLLSRISNKKVRMIFFLLLNFIIGFPFYYLCNKIIRFPDGSFFYQFGEMIAILPEGLNTMTVGYSPFTVQPHRVALILTWIFLLYTAYCFCYLKKSRSEMIPLIFGIFATLIALFFTLLPHTSIAFDSRIDGYFHRKRAEYDSWEIGRWDEEAGFRVLKYEMELSALFHLRAKVNMAIDRQDLSEYKFTLYREYDITKVTDQNGNSLSYVREGDYFTVYPDEVPLTNIYIEYSGSGDPFCADLSTVHLPSGFAFYPMAGYHPIYEDERYGVDFYNRIHLPETTEYHVAIHTMGTVYSSLNREDGNSFSGVSDGFFLLKGMVETDVINGVTFYYPSNYPVDGNLAEWREMERNFITQLNEIYKEFEELDSIQEGTTIVMDWEYFNLFEISSVFSDHITAIYFSAEGGFGDEFREFYRFDYH